MRSARAVLLAFLLAAFPAAADPFDDTLKAYGLDDYSILLKSTFPLASRGNFKAQVVLGDMYESDKGV